MAMDITPETARADLEKVLGTFTTFGPGTPQERAAQLVLQTMGVLRRRLSSPSVIKMLYIDNPEARTMLPGAVVVVAESYIAGTITQEQASTQLENAEQEYRKVFSSLGYTPQSSRVLGMR
jgi:hypothetical protein